MPLLDHFHKPLAERRHWESFHGGWAYEIMRALNRGILPPGYFAESRVHIGTEVEIDIASFAETEHEAYPEEGKGGVAVQTWAPPVATLSMPAVFPDEIEVRVFRSSGGANLVAAVELASPANKDRPETRRAFAAKCAAYLQQGIGLVIVDVVTDRQANLHDELIDLLQQTATFAFPCDSPLYAVAYKPVRRKEEEKIEILPYTLSVGQSLPTVPLPLRGGPTLPLDLEGTYMETCGGIRL